MRRLLLVLALVAAPAAVVPPAQGQVADRLTAAADNPPPAETQPAEDPPPAADEPPAEGDPPAADGEDAALAEIPVEDVPVEDVPLEDVPLDDVVLDEPLDEEPLDEGALLEDPPAAGEAVGGDDVAAEALAGLGDAAPPARLGRRLTLVTAAGALVRVRRPGAARATRLLGAASVPPGVVVDARRGAVVVRSARPGGRPDGVTVLAGAVVALGQDARGVLELRLRGRAPACGARARRPAGRRLQAAADAGAVRTIARRSTTTARDAAWRVEETCAGTRTTALTGVADVRDRRARRPVRVTAGRSHLARRTR